MKIKNLSTRERIIDTTISLMGEHGLFNVKLRDVSGALDISLGNLTYYFPKWEFLIETIYERFVGEISVAHVDFPKDVSGLPLYIARVYDIQIKYGFLFANLQQFFEEYPQFRGSMNKFFETRLQGFNDLIDKSVQLGYFQEPSQVHDYQLLSKNTWLILSCWYSFSHSFDGTSFAYTRTDYFMSIWNLYCPHLTIRGREVVRHKFNAILNLRKNFGRISQFKKTEFV